MGAELAQIIVEEHSRANGSAPGRPYPLSFARQVIRGGMITACGPAGPVLLTGVPKTSKHLSGFVAATYALRQLGDDQVDRGSAPVETPRDKPQVRRAEHRELLKKAIFLGAGEPAWPRRMHARQGIAAVEPWGGKEDRDKNC